MVAYYSNSHKLHNPSAEVFDGNRVLPQEVAQRAMRIFESLSESGVKLKKANKKITNNFLAQIHDLGYLDYLRDVDGVRDVEFPSVFSIRDQGSTPTNKFALRGYYAFDMFTPVDKNTFLAAIGSAEAALSAASGIVEGESRYAYALCRPPGHHAEFSQMGGYCYINNAAVAAQFLLGMGKVAILDVDFHHGNGTQGIFYAKPEVFTVSIHADPKYKFPYFSGYADEKGHGKGRGYNFNIPLELGIRNGEYQEILEKALERIEKFKPDFLVIAFGADTHVSDPIGGFKLTTSYYTRMAQTIAQIDVPVVIVQEGGYNSKALGENLISFLNGFEVK